VIGRLPSFPQAAFQQATIGPVPALDPHGSPSPFHPESRTSSIFGPDRAERPFSARHYPQAAIAGPQQAEGLRALAGTCHIENVFGLPQQTAHEGSYRTG
jgi:hypothetical protein